MGLSLLLSPPASTPSDLQILNNVWKVVTKFKEPAVNIFIKKEKKTKIMKIRDYSLIYAIFYF